MFSESSSQSSLFEIERLCPGVLPKDDWSYTYQTKVLPLIDEKKFRHLYSKDAGRPNASIRTMVSLLIFMGMEKLSWRAVEFQFARRIDWLIATHTPPGEAEIDHTTIFKFYQRLEKDATAKELFVDLTQAFIEACGTSLKKQRTDSFYIYGWLQTLSRYGLFKETIRKFLQVLRKQKPGLYEKIKGELSRDYLKKEFDLTEKDRELAQRKISLMARDLLRLKSAFEHHKQVGHYQTFETLCQIFSQQCEVKDTVDAEVEASSIELPRPPEIVIKEKPDQGSICSPHNTEVRYVRKGKQRVTGDKGVVTETCDPENKTQFLTDVQVVDAPCPDSKEQPHLEDRLIENGFKPEKQYEDAGFVNGQTILNAKEKGIELEGPSSGRSQSFEAYEKKDRPFDAGDFETTFDDRTKDALLYWTVHLKELIVHKCPNTQEPQDQKRSEKTGKLLVHFDPAVCSACSYAERCPVKIGKRVATYTVDEAAVAGAVRHHRYMSNEAYREECAVRAGVEATVSELTRAHGMRKSRHRTQSRTRLQLIFAALACNVKRFIRHGKQYAYFAPKVVGLALFSSAKAKYRHLREHLLHQIACSFK